MVIVLLQHAESITNRHPLSYADAYMPLSPTLMQLHSARVVKNLTTIIIISNNESSCTDPPSLHTWMVYQIDLNAATCIIEEI